jgi:hypothetical protein
MAALGWALNLGFAGSDSGAPPPLTLMGHLALLGVGRCWWWLAPLAFALTGIV